MVVRQHHGGCLEVQGAQHHFARVHAGLRERAAKQLFEGNQPVLAVEEQHGKHLMALGRQVQLKEVARRIRRIEDLALTQLLGQRPPGEFEHRHQFGAFGGPQALDAREVCRAGVQQAGDAAKTTRRAARVGTGARGIEQFLRQLQHALADDAGAQQQRQQLRVAERGRAAGE